METQNPMLYVTKRVEFAAAHRLFKPELSEEENRALFDKCANPFGHGHNYLLEATFKGRLNPKTEMVLHFSLLKKLLKEYVVIPMDHRNLNHDVEFMKGILPTSENIVVHLWTQLAGALKGETFSLHRLRLSSSPRNIVEYFGPDGEAA